MPERQRRKHWLLFGALALTYIIVGIGIRHREVQRTEKDGRELDGLRHDLSNMLPLIPQVASLRSDFGVLIEVEEEKKETHDPRLIGELRASLSNSTAMLVALTPAVISQLREGEQHWEEDWKQVDRLTETMFHGGNAETKQQAFATRTARLAAVDQQYQDKLKDVMLMAAYLRQAMLDRLPTAQRAEQGAATPPPFRNLPLLISTIQTCPQPLII